MIITTTNVVQGKDVTHYHGVVCGETILGANIVKDLFASIRDIVGGRAGAYEEELRRARDIAFAEMSRAAEELGANAIVGVDVDYETVGSTGGMLMVSVNGTAVTLRAARALPAGGAVEAETA